jgi:hypothetical protein
MRIRILGSVPPTNGSGCGCGSVPKSSVAGCKKFYFVFSNGLIRKFKSLKIVKICFVIKIKFLAKNCFMKILFSTIISVAKHFYKKREGSGSVLVANGSGFGYGTLSTLYGYFFVMNSIRPSAG